ncbi:CTP synthase [Stenotrophomonas sp. MMGLT7]|uniref:CTP synthase C-terminal region-related (seleno)protein n=1 Tax=Stenotrophomonas sp. MMGLT7 TaxID=2901227 RepID=UPI001E38E7D8
MKRARIGLVGDFDDTVVAHQGIPPSLRDSAESIGLHLTFEWLATDKIVSVESVSGFSGIWCVPTTPYRSMEGALLAIQYAREGRIPFLGTCGGFQHAIIEYARNVLGWADADHAESSPDTVCPVISPLACSLVETTEIVNIFQGSRLAQIYGTLKIFEGYRCRYGLNPDFRKALLGGPLIGSADDATGEIRAVELLDHPFFLATLFQPERAALKGETSPLIRAFVQACAA